MATDGDKIAKVAAQWAEQAAKIWNVAVEDAQEHLALVLKNNPNKSPEDILKRPDVKAALTQPFEDAASRTVVLLHGAWDDGVGVGRGIARQRLREAGSASVGKQDVPPEVLDSLRVDLINLAETARTRVEAAFEEKDMEKVGKALARQRLWASMSIEMAVKRGANEALLAEYRAAGAGKEWVSRLAKNTCAYCKLLHGQVKPWDVPFDTLGKVYGGVLMTPPRHPWCQCFIKPSFESKVVTTGQEKPSSVVLTSKQMATMHPSVLEKILQWLARWLSR